MFPNLIFMSCLFLNIEGFNVDTEYPIIYSDPRKQNGSYFGYSVVMFPGYEWSHNRWILVGAPKANGTMDINSGEVYKCEWLNNMQCSAEKFPDMEEDNYWRNSFLGGSMDISYNYSRIVACAYRKFQPFKSYDVIPGVCYGMDVSNNNLTYKKLPLPESSKQSCETGFSLAFNPKNPNQLLIGAPAYNNMTGVVLRVMGDSTKSDGFFSKAPFVSNVNSMSIDTMNGYALTIGKFRGSGLYYAAGKAKGAHGRGEVGLFRLSDFEYEATLKGDQYGEFFGASLAAGRISGGTFDNLVVGSPYYNEKEYEYYNQGKVSVYLCVPKLKTYIRISVLYGNSKNGHFGAAIMYLGDIDRDEFGDVAIGAPYEHDGSGTVYIHRGFKDGLHKTPAQVIQGRSVYENLRGFGVSISRPADMDENNYKDVAIGAHVSGHVVILRSKPVAVVVYSFSAEPEILDVGSKNVTLSAEFSYSVFDKETLDIKCKVQVERVNFMEEYNHTLTKNKTNVRRFIVDLKDITSQDTSVIATLSYELARKNDKAHKVTVDSKSKLREDLFCVKCPVLDPIRSTNATGQIEIPISWGCGLDKICKSNLTIVSIDVAELGGTNVFVVGSANNIRLQINLANYGEHAYSSSLNVTVPEAVAFVQVPAYCVQKDQLTSTVCDIGNPFKQDTKKAVDLIIDVSRLDMEYTLQQLEVLLKIESINATISDKFMLILRREADVAIYSPTELSSSYFENSTNGIANFSQVFNVEREGNSSIETVLVKIDIPYKYTSEDQEVMFLQIYHPKATFFEENMKCKSPLAFKEELSPPENYREVPRARREIHDQIVDDSTNQLLNTTARRLIFNKNIFTLQCDNASVECISIECKFGPYAYDDPPVNIELKMLFNTTALEGILDSHDSVLIESKAFVEIQSPTGMIPSGNRSHMVEFFHLFKATPRRSIGIWYIILGISLGILLLIILIVVLIKVGFFKRKTKEELDLLKAQVQREEGESPEAEIPDPDYEEVTMRNSVVMSEIMNKSTDGLCESEDS